MILVPEFTLEAAAWPALLVDAGGAVARANAAALRVFGPALSQPGARIESIWSPLNGVSCAAFLSSDGGTRPVSIKLKANGGAPVEFAAVISPTAGGSLLVQLFAPAPGPSSAAADDSAVAHKQKLDCALQLARSVALDFNNALTGILGHASLLLGKSDANHPWRPSLAEIEKSAAKAAEIAHDLATFSRQEKDDPVRMAGNMNLVIEHTIDIYQGSAPKAVKFSRQLERKLFLAEFDEAKLQQALVKIFDNAVEASGGAGAINVLTRNLTLTEPTHDRTARLNAGNYICVEISDGGAGIAPEALPRVFEPFFTTKGARHRGLGLAWVYGVVTNHGGGVAVSSQPGMGAVVRFYLPATTRTVREAPAAEEELHGTATVLMVDDEDLLLNMGRTVLGAYGYTVLTAADGRQALETRRRHSQKIDLTIIDLVMPQMGGRELGEHILRAEPGARILWTSGYGKAAAPRERERYLEKPFTAQELLRKVKHVLSR